ncbi:uncharacterized protein VTP21DRAFT_58 [Calcarisporiella thermophila]|uniref:uncharacterized protein n=1 Tax=Calcarisporiella thermophila TaxID=911321 RepID=UPI003743A88E
MAAPMHDSYPLIIELPSTPSAEDPTLTYSTSSDYEIISDTSSSLSDFVELTTSPLQEEDWDDLIGDLGDTEEEAAKHDGPVICEVTAEVAKEIGEIQVESTVLVEEVDEVDEMEQVAL